MSPFPIAGAVTKSGAGDLDRTPPVFQAAMRYNEQLTSTVRSDAEARLKRQDAIAAETARFSADIEATLNGLMKCRDAQKRHRPN